MRDNQARRAQQRALEAAEAARLKALAAEQEAALEVIKREKMAALAAAGVGAGFQTKLAKLKV